MRRLVAMMILVVAIQRSCVGMKDTAPNSSWPPPGPSPTHGPSHTLTSSTLAWKETWRRQVGPSYTSVPLLAASGDLLTLPIWGEGETIVLALSALDGHTLWTQKATDLDFPDRQIRVVSSLFAGSNVVYVALPFAVQALRLEDGQLAWTTRRLPEHTSYYLFPAPNDGAIRLYGITGSKTVLYDIGIDDGQIKFVEEYPTRVVLKTDTVECVEDALDLQCVDSGVLSRWNVSTRGSVRPWPTYVDSSVMLFASGPHLSSLTAVDPASGRVVWQTPEDIVSNFTTIDDVVYTLEFDTSLVARDAFTGREVGRMQLGGGPLDVESGAEYWVTAADDRLYVYFGDSQELIAFSPD